MAQYRQGDVLIEATAIPAEATLVPQEGRVVLAEGELTGHAHTISKDEVKVFTFDRDMFLRVGEVPATLRHQEHAKIVLPPGDYKVTRQVEYTPQGLRQVAD